MLRLIIWMDLIAFIFLNTTKRIIVRKLFEILDQSLLLNFKVIYKFQSTFWINSLTNLSCWNFFKIFWKLLLKSIFKIEITIKIEKLESLQKLHYIFSILNFLWISTLFKKKLLLHRCYYNKSIRYQLSHLLQFPKLFHIKIVLQIFYKLQIQFPFD